MFKLNQKKLVFFLILAILSIIGFDIYLFFQANKTELYQEGNNNENASDLLELKVACYRIKENVFYEPVGIDLNIMDDYVFYVKENKEMVIDRNLTTYAFKNLEELNHFYNYWLVKFPDIQLTKNEEKLELSFQIKTMWGGYKSYSEEYKEYLNEHEYSCVEAEVVSS